MTAAAAMVDHIAVLKAHKQDSPSGCPYRLCMVRYPFVRGCGPWNYFYEKPPADVAHIWHVGYFIDADDRWIRIASDLYTDAAGAWHPVRLVHFPPDIDIAFYDGGSLAGPGA